MKKFFLCASVVGMILSSPTFAASPSAQDEVLIMRKVVSPRRAPFEGEIQPTPTPDPSGNPNQNQNPTPNPSVIYNWSQGPWTAFSSMCSENSQRYREVRCEDQNGNVAPDESLCSGTKPAEEEIASVISGCQYAWQPGPWSPWSNVCGLASRSRAVDCVGTFDSGVTFAAVSNQCASAGTQPTTTEQAVNDSGCLGITNPHFDVDLNGWTTRNTTWNSGAAILTGGAFNGTVAPTAQLTQNFPTTRGRTYTVTLRYRNTGTTCTHSMHGTVGIFRLNGLTPGSAYFTPARSLCPTPEIITESINFTADTDMTQIVFFVGSFPGQTVTVRVEDIILT